MYCPYVLGVMELLYILALLLGVAAGMAVKGRIGNLADARLEKKGFILAALCIQVTLQILGVRGILPVQRFGPWSFLVVVGLLLAGLWANRRYAGVLVIGVGYLMNALVMAVNGCKMPVSADALKKAGLLDALDILKAGIDGKHIIIAESTKLPFLSDIIVLPRLLRRMMEIVSIGDLVIAAGILVLVFEMLTKMELGKKLGKLRIGNRDRTPL
jgi:hypothetical protein